MILYNRNVSGTEDEHCKILRNIVYPIVNIVIGRRKKFKLYRIIQKIQSVIIGYSN